MSEQSRDAAAGKREPLRLHIGGEETKPGWKILNIQPMAGVDFIGTATDLSQFGDGTVDEIYGSHIYEHLDYKDELLGALKEAFRVLKPGGLFRAGVPDLEALCRLMLTPNMASDHKFFVMRMIYGGHVDAFDYHKVGLTFEIFGSYLHEAGFRHIRRVTAFNLFTDTTTKVFEGVPISLNMMAMKP